jgi:signal transduction histidine kinase/DNA-binding response OmpR family regulator
MFIDSQGRVHLGGLGGSYVVDPDMIALDSSAPRLIMFEPDLPFAGKTEPRQASESALWSGRTVRMRSGQRSIRFSFTAINFRDPQGVRYSAFLDGYDRGWRPAGTDRSARYTNLEPGAYTFRLRAVSASGIWTKPGIAVPVIVLPPWWRTGWAYGGYALLLVSMLVGAERLRRASIVESERRRAAIRESQIRSEVAEAKAIHAAQFAHQLQELDEAKSRFFANLSHEFRTPLTLILGLMEDARGERYGPISQRLRQVLGVVMTNASRAHRLVRRLLDLSRLESGHLELSLKRADPSEIVSRAVQALAALAERNGVALQHRVPLRRFTAAFDSEQLQTAIENLVSNAIRFTEPGGIVAVSLRVTEGPQGDLLRIDVRDTGVGIGREDQKRIFERFTQVDTSSTRRNEGLGIGLALVREIVTLHGGTLSVDSEPGVGSVFSIALPMNGYSAAATVASTQPAGRLPSPGDDTDVPREPTGLEQAGIGASPGTERVDAESGPQSRRSIDGQPVVLIVEDNADVRAFLKDHFATTFSVREAEDGAVGLVEVRLDPPDLIIADVMMPGMDGIELCTSLKNESTTRHIPVILLTARAGEAEALEGLQAGADEYVTKPFSVALLRQLAENLVSTRTTMRDRYSRTVVVEPSGVEIDADHEAFLRRITEIIEDHLSDADLTIDRVADEACLSRRQLERRLLDSCRESPSHLVRRMRMKRACQLLEAEAGTISEIARATGYRSVSSFGAVFRKTFGMSPSEYRVANGIGNRKAVGTGGPEKEPN